MLFSDSESVEKNSNIVSHCQEELSSNEESRLKDETSSKNNCSIDNEGGSKAFMRDYLKTLAPILPTKKPLETSLGFTFLDRDNKVIWCNFKARQQFELSVHAQSHDIDFFKKEFFITNHSRWLLKQKLQSPQNPLLFTLIIYSKNKKQKYKKILKESKKLEVKQELQNDTHHLALFYKYLKSISCEGLQTSLRIKKSVLENR